MNKIKFQKGITLIALIITVIVLIILAVITIKPIKENDLIGYSQNTTKQYEEKVAEEDSKKDNYKENLKDTLGASFVTGKAEVEAIVNKNSTIDGNVPSSDNPLIPAGFKAINTDTSSWDAEGGPEVDKGLVIEDEDENQFVWIPVPDINKFAKLQKGSNVNYEGVLYNFSVTSTTEKTNYGIGTTSYREPDVVTYLAPSETVDSTSGTKCDADLYYLKKAGCTEDLNDDGTVNVYDFKNQLQKEFNEMVVSIAKYKGFYVGRYETSMNGTNPQSKASTEEETITTVATYETGTGSNEIRWYDLYALNKRYNTNSVRASMMWGSQYDAMINWMGDAANTAIGDDRNMNRTCGTAANDVINNVYDLYGNSREWTLEANNTCFRVYRGRFLR